MFVKHLLQLEPKLGWLLVGKELDDFRCFKCLTDSALDGQSNTPQLADESHISCHHFLEGRLKLSG